jgi:GNAT superfamily N-acetyltransferase
VRGGADFWLSPPPDGGHTCIVEEVHCLFSTRDRCRSYGVRMDTTTADVETAVRVLTAAFADDPVGRWLTAGDPAVAELIFRPAVLGSAARGELAVSPDGAAAAVWLPRPAEPAAVDQEPLPAELARLRTFLALTGTCHPVGRQHLYLVFLGVLPAAQGRGLGGALLRERLARADADGVPAYLEAGSERSLPLYARHGFRPAGAPVRLPDGPRVRPMWRAVRA